MLLIVSLRLGNMAANSEGVCQAAIISHGPSNVNRASNIAHGTKISPIAT
jgi:hypothetical protein